jgi:ATP-binding cassette, subfamily B, bacterial HlyB/CyaB
MTQAIPASLASLLEAAPFQLLSPVARARLLEAASLQRFELGQTLSSGDAIGQWVLLVVEGEARLLGEHDGRPFTLERLGSGQLIGLASLLRAQGCEQVSAATRWWQRRFPMP